MSIKIKNMRRRMVRLQLGDQLRKPVVVQVASLARGRGQPGGMAVTDGSRGRTRLSVTQDLILPAMAVVDQMPSGAPIPDDIASVPTIAAAVARGDIEIEG